MNRSSHSPAQHPSTWTRPKLASSRTQPNRTTHHTQNKSNRLQLPVQPDRRHDPAPNDGRTRRNTRQTRYFHHFRRNLQRKHIRRGTPFIRSIPGTQRQTISHPRPIQIPFHDRLAHRLPARSRRMDNTSRQSARLQHHLRKRPVPTRRHLRTNRMPTHACGNEPRIYPSPRLHLHPAHQYGPPDRQTERRILHFSFY